MPSHKMQYGTVLNAGLFVGTLDIIAACVNFNINTHKNPIIVLKYVGSALLGDIAYKSGIQPIFVGLICHYTVALFYTFLLFFIIKKAPELLRYKVIVAIVYGIFMWAFMRFVILPFTHVKIGSLTWIYALIDIGILVVCISIPLLYIFEKVLCGKVSKQKNQQNDF